jgi:hypothetical protein
MAHDPRIPGLQFVLRGQFALQQQVSDLQEGAVFGQLFDGIASIPQNPVLAVEIGDGALAGRGI